VLAGGFSGFDDLLQLSILLTDSLGEHKRDVFRIRSITLAAVETHKLVDMRILLCTCLTLTKLDHSMVKIGLCYFFVTLC